MILVTGGSGMIGRAIIRRLADKADIRAPVRTAGTSVGGKEVIFDLANENESDYDSLVAGCETVIHCAALVHHANAPREDYAIYNVRATRLLAAAAERARVKTFVFLSTSAVYGDGPFVDATESTKLSLDTPYALSKSNCEEALRRCDELRRRIILRPALVYGSGDRGNMQALIRQIEKRKYFHVGGNAACKSLIHADDLALAVELCLQQVPAGFHVLNVANPEPIGVIELANIIASRLGQPAPPVVPQPLVAFGAAAAEKLLGKKAPLTPEKLRKLTTSTTLSVQELVKATGFSPQVTVTAGIGDEISSLENDIKSAQVPIKTT